MELKDKLVHKDKAVQKVLDFVKTQADIDVKLVDRILLDNKTVDKMWNYIVNKAKKLSVNNSAVVEDETVYNWAIHYFIEDDKEVEVKQETKEEQEEKEIPTKVEAKPDVEQLSLDI